MPNGFEGVLKGVSAVFYAYIGFDAISTTAEECKNPKRDMPRGMIYSLLICTVLYILITLVLTGMERYDRFEGVNDPLAFVFENRAPWIEKIISVSAIIATTSVLLVFQIGQPRIWMSMSRDGLLPKKFQQLHPKYQTPAFATIVTGIFIGLGAMLIRSGLVTDLTSIGTLFAFVLVSAGVLFLPPVKPEPGKFSLPYINGQWIIPVLFGVLIWFLQDRVIGILNLMGSGQWTTITLVEYLFLTYVLIGVVLSVMTFLRKYSLIPIMGVLSCMYLMIEIPGISWVWFLCWMGGGLLIYFLYGYRNSRLAVSGKP
jgi:amino acid transporter